MEVTTPKETVNWRQPGGSIDPIGLFLLEGETDS